MTVAPVVVTAVVPVLSVLIGAAMTYWLNVRSRRRTHVDDLFNNAIAAVAVADASKSYVRRVARPVELSDEEYRELLVGMAKRAIEGHTQRAAEAREALARVLPFEPRVRPFEPRVRPFYVDAEAITKQPDAVIGLLKEAQRPGPPSSTQRHARAWVTSLILTDRSI